MNTTPTTAVVSSEMVRRLAEDWEREALEMEKQSGDRNNDVSHAIRWCRHGLLSAKGKSPNDQLTRDDGQGPHVTTKVATESAKSRRDPVAGSVITVLFCGDDTVGWTANAQWAMRWENQLRGRWSQPLREIKPHSPNDRTDPRGG